MKTQISITRCDCCNQTIPQRDTFLNDGSFQGTHLTQKCGEQEIDLCFNCVGKIITKNHIEIENLKDKIRQMQPFSYSINSAPEKLLECVLDIG